MEQEGDGGSGGDMNKQPRDRRLKEIEQGDGQVQVQPQPQPQQPQKCPRCDSLNTKFCYYNNYSLTQPRYFCKTCRRYWTQGGTLRNVPVGGGCRKGKRAKSSSSSSSSENSSRPAQPLPPPQKMVVQTQPTLTTVARARDPSSVASPSISPFYQGVGVGGGDGGYLSSLAAMNQLNPPSHPFDQSLNVGGGDVMRSSNLGLLSGFNVAALASQRQIRPSQFYQVGSGGRDQVVSLYASEQGLIPSSMANNTSAATHHDWPQNFINNNASNRASDASLWSTISTTSIGGANSDRSAAAGSTPLAPNQWPDLPGFHPPS